MRKLTKNVIMFSTADWSNPFWTNKQHTAQQLADKGYKVLYIESLGLRAPTIGKRDIKRIFKRLLKFFQGSRRVHRNIWVYSPLVIPFHRFKLVKMINSVLMRVSLVFYKYRLGMRGCTVWTYNPLVRPLTKCLRHRYLVYHCVDDLSAAPGIPSETIKLAEDEMVNKADIVFATSRRLEEICKSYTDDKGKVHYFSNVADYDHFHRSTNIRDIPEDIAHIPSPRIGFVGAISEYKLDFKLISDLADKHPDHNWILVGQVGEGQPSTKVDLLKKRNIHIIGPRSYQELPSYLAGFDVVALPCPINDYTSSMFPMKFFEYLSANKKLVTTELPAIEEYSKAFFWSQGRAEFEENLLKALNENCSEMRSVADKMAQDHTWEKRLHRMLEKAKLSSQEDVKRVLMISSRADIGGGPKHMHDLIRDLSKLNGKNLELFIASPDEKPYGGFFKKHSKAFVSLPTRRVYIAKLIKLIYLCRKYRISYVHSHGRGAGIYSRLLSFFGPYVIHTFHGVHIEKGIIGWMKRTTDCLLAPLTDAFICVSNDEKEKAIKWKFADPSNIRVILNGVDLESIDSKRVERPETAKVVVGTLARLSFQKGLDVQLELIAKFRENNPELDVEFQIAGDGEKEESIFNLAKQLGLDGYVKFLGPTDKPIEFLSSLDIYLSTSRWEGLPLSVLEAMACKKACLLSDVTGHRDLAINGAVELFDFKDYSSFEKEILDLINDKTRRDELAHKARCEVEERFTSRRVAQEVFEIIN